MEVDDHEERMREMPANVFFNGISPSLWYSHILFNSMFGAKFSPTSGLPAYLPSQASARTEAASPQLKALNGLYKRQYDLLTEAEKLSAANSASSVFFQKTASSSDADVVEVYLNGNNYEGAVPDSTFDFEVTALLKAQINEGSEFDPDAVTTITDGSQFKITSEGTDYNVTLSLAPADDWETALSHMASEINDLGMGVTAAVVYLDSGNIQLRLTGQEGETNSFSASDVSGNAVSATGINTSTQAATDYGYLVNGVSYQQANDRVFLLDGKLEVRLKDLGQATVTVEPDRAGVLAAAGDVAAAMNEMTSFLASNQYLSGSLSSRWAGLVDRAALTLSSYGLSDDPYGQLTLDSAELYQSLEDNWSAVQKAWGGPSGLVAELKSFAELITGSSGASLLMFPPDTGFGATYLRSLSSAPRFRTGGSYFWQVI